MLTVRGLHCGYGAAQVLFGVDLELPGGSVLCVMGRNGVGKTTLLKTLMGVLPATAGSVTFAGTDVTALPTSRRVRLGMGYVPQGHETFPQLTVWENLLVTWEATGRRDRGPLDEALDVFPRLRPLLDRRAGFLSGGQQQQLAIARALVTRPTLLILDEPTEGIQPSIVAEIEEAIVHLHAERGLAVLLVEQYLEFANRLADRVIVLDGGRVGYRGDGRGVLDLTDDNVRQMLAV